MYFFKMLILPLKSRSLTSNLICAQRQSNFQITHFWPVIIGSGAASNPDDEDSTEKVDKNDLEMNAYLRRSRNEDEEEDIKVLDPVDDDSTTIDAPSTSKLYRKFSNSFVL